MRKLWETDDVTAWVLFLCVCCAKDKNSERNMGRKKIKTIQLNLQMFIRAEWFSNTASRRTFLPTVPHSLAGSWVLNNASAWHYRMAFFFFFLNSEKGRGRREKDALWSINNSCSADDLWIAVVNRLLWLLNQLHYMPARKKKNDQRLPCWCDCCG